MRDKNKDIIVLHAFLKKTRKTPKKTLTLPCKTSLRPATVQNCNVYSPSSSSALHSRLLNNAAWRSN
ncbi:hypothetical protein PCI56_03160 [Plesiomonas shigelloides subsp. oncorhynchi]|nr:hypothetical protein [Plesiomonas shigelloides]MDA1379038.1 hypothetical protein [Plesiomonas shigelloides]